MPIQAFRPERFRTYGMLMNLRFYFKQFESDINQVRNSIVQSLRIAFFDLTRSLNEPSRQ